MGSERWPVTWYGLVSAAGFALHYQVAYFELFVVLAADGDEVVDVGVSADSVRKMSLGTGPTPMIS